MQQGGNFMSEDNWKHRSKGMICNSCMWFVRKEVIQAPGLARKTGPQEYTTYELPTATPTRGLGRCRRHAPTMNGFPAVFEEDWCGDHKLDENKI